MRFILNSHVVSFEQVNVYFILVGHGVMCVRLLRSEELTGGGRAHGSV